MCDFGNTESISQTLYCIVVALIFLGLTGQRAEQPSILVKVEIVCCVLLVCF